MTVNLVDHALGAMADEVGDIVFWNIQRQHDGHSIVAQVMETIMADAFAFQKFLKTVGDDIRLDRDISVCVVTVLSALLGGLGGQQGGGYGREQPNRARARRGLGALLNELKILH